MDGLWRQWSVLIPPTPVLLHSKVSGSWWISLLALLEPGGKKEERSLRRSFRLSANDESPSFRQRNDNVWFLSDVTRDVERVFIARHRNEESSFANFIGSALWTQSLKSWLRSPHRLPCSHSPPPFQARHSVFFYVWNVLKITYISEHRQTTQRSMPSPKIS